MGEVVGFSEAREARQPKIAGTCICLGCRHEWPSEADPGNAVGLLCPECKLPKGVFKYLVGSSGDDLLFTCPCTCEALTAYIRDGYKRVKCMSCGLDLTDGFYS